MIITELKGGLGNQMFQYASALGIAKKTNQKFFVNMEWFEANKDAATPRDYELSCFELPSLVTVKLEDILFENDYKSIKKVFKTTLKRYAEPSFRYDEQVYDCRNSYLDGYWQSSLYFEYYRETILDEFKFKHLPAGNNLRYANHIASTEQSVSLHIRRGDYVTNVQHNKTHGTVGLDYYKIAIAEITKKLDKPHFFIISDDIDWCKRELMIDFPHTYIVGNTKGEYDMQLMSMCKNNIIANSSFSWWGAWLNMNPEKIVIAPKKWFNDSSIDTSDLIPADWMRL
jgi:hypothetical protein